MTCEQYRAALHRKLDTRQAGDLAPEFRAHANACEDCAKYTAAILNIDKGLASIQPAPLPQGLIESLLKIPRSPAAWPELSWRPLVIREFGYSVAAIAIWEVARLAPPSMQIAAAIALPCFGVLIFLLSALRQGMLGES